MCLIMLCMYVIHSFIDSELVIFPFVPIISGVKGDQNTEVIDGEVDKSSDKDWEKDCIPIPSEASESQSQSKPQLTPSQNGAINSRPQTPNLNIVANQLISNTSWHSCRKLIYVPRSAQKGFAVGFWPIPESFWPDVSASALVSGKLL